MNKILEEDALQIIKENKELKDLKNTTFMITGASGMVGIYFVNTLLVLNEKYDYKINLYLVLRNEKKLPSYILDNKYVHIIKQDVTLPIACNENMDYIVLY